MVRSSSIQQEAGKAGPSTSGGSPVKDGQFSIARDHGLVPGNYNVAIHAGGSRPQLQIPKKSSTERPGRAGHLSKVARELIPAQYNANSTLTAEIKQGGGNNLEFKLLSK